MRDSGRLGGRGLPDHGVLGRVCSTRLDPLVCQPASTRAGAPPALGARAARGRRLLVARRRVGVESHVQLGAKLRALLRRAGRAARAAQLGLPALRAARGFSVGSATRPQSR